MEMEKIKVFGGKCEAGTGFHRLTEAVNAWLREEGKKITITHRQVTIDETGDEATVWIFYVSR